VKGYCVFIVNSARQVESGRFSMVSATTPEAGEALRERMALVKRRMGELAFEEETKQGRSGDGPLQTASS
jgi:hypothetical protein